MNSDENSVQALQLKQVRRDFSTPDGKTLVAIESFNLEVPAGSFISIVGPSGCGKTTILNLVAGLLQPTSGTVEVFGHPLQGLNREASYLFQQDALLPWKTVLQNTELGLRIRGIDRQKAREQAMEWIARVGLSGFANHYPDQISGGMRKRVALAQSWITRPKLILMDEPFSALDVHTRQRMETEILSLWSDRRETVIFVTHDLEEAISLSDKVVVMSSGPDSTVVGTYAVDLPRPRRIMDIKTDPSFVDLYRKIWAAMRPEVLKGYDADLET
jgi:sulfonate transport system ATP-binding protein